MKRFIKDYFIFSKKERIALMVLLVLLSGFIVAPYLYEPEAEMPPVNTELAEFLAGTAAENVSTPAKPDNSVAPAHKTDAFPFNPNTINEADWRRLGLSERTIRTIMNYRNKGGRFRQADDIRKIWGLKKEDADRLVPFVQLEQRVETPKLNQAPAPVPKEPAVLDINTAGLEDWKSLPGIGDVLANRIIKFRDRSGGFLSVEQVGKTYGISDSLFLQIQPRLRFSVASVPKLNLNTATVFELRNRTGMSYSLAKSIIEYRTANGPYRAIQDVKAAGNLPDSTWQKLLLLTKTE